MARVISATLAANANLVVSGDRDMLSMGSYEGIAIVSTSAEVQRITA